MNKLCRYKDVLTILIPHNFNYYTYPIEDYDIDIPLVISNQDPAIEMISIAKLHFSEARNIIRMLIEDVSIEDVSAEVTEVAKPAPKLNIATQTAYTPITKAALASHAIFNREF